MRFGIVEFLILLVIILIVLGPGRISKVAGELGQGIRKFKEGMGKKDEEEAQEPPKLEK